MTDADLRAFISEQGLAARLVYPGVPTPTVPDAAAALGVQPQQILKSLVFLADGEPLLVLATGEARIDYRALAGALGISRKRLRLATPEAALMVSGYEVGAMPPFGHRRALPSLLDERGLPAEAAAPEEVILYGGGGSRSALLELSLATLREVTKARLVPLSEVP